MIILSFERSGYTPETIFKWHGSLSRSDVFETEPAHIVLFNEELEDTKGVIWIRISRKDRPYNDQNEKDKMT